MTATPAPACISGAPTEAIPGSALTASTRGSTTVGSLGDVDGDHHRTVAARTEPLGHQVVGLALGPALGQRTVVGDAGTQRNDRRGESEQQHGDAHGVRPRVAGHVPDPS